MNCLDKKKQFEGPPRQTRNQKCNVFNDSDPETPRVKIIVQVRYASLKLPPRRATSAI